ncbi:Protease PrsW (Protease responsible for activating sigma-W) [Durusdinium trenchii]|uniref:Protease PrsW (Protease responsible for activating sigma-W) n=1 Tax=Durusdinium trenchii TaxID=1381693 RepID=A0ABP0QV34_9DINO
MGNGGSELERPRDIGVPEGGVSEEELHQFLRGLLQNEKALADVCGSLCDEAFVPAESLQPLTQQLIDRLRCRDPQTLERIGEVYSSFAERPGLTPLEFQGYVACVLTQILRPLDARNEPRNEPPRARPFAATLQAEAPAEAPPPAEAPEAPEELSELQRLAKELDSLNASLTEHQKEPLPAPMDLEKAPAPTEVKAETAHEVEQKDEMAHLLANLDDLNSSLQPLRRRASPTRDDTAAAEHMAPGCAAEARRTALAPEKYVQGPHAHPQPGHPHHHQPGHPHHLQPRHPHHPQPAHPHYPQHPSSPPRDVAHSLEHVFPVAPQAQQAQQGMMAQTAQHRHAGRSPLGPAEAFDAGNTYARALRGGAGAAARGAGLERRMEVPEEGPMMPEAGLTMEGPPMGAAIPGPMPAALAAAMPVANAVNSRLQGAGKGIAYSWQAFAETMDSIFAGDASSHAAGPEPEVALPEVALPAPAPMPAPEDVPLIFRQPTVEEVREVLEQEGLLAYVATAAGSFCPKKLCLDSSYLYILEPDSSIPAVFFGMQGFCLDDLQRVVLNEAHLDSSSKPLLSLEFEEGRRKGDRPPRSEGHEGSEATGRRSPAAAEKKKAARTLAVDFTRVAIVSVVDLVRRLDSGAAAKTSGCEAKSTILDQCVMLCLYGDNVVVLTPDRDLESTRLATGSVYSEIRKMTSGKLPAGIRERETYLPKHSPNGVILHDEMRTLMSNAERRFAADGTRRRVVGRLEEPEGVVSPEAQAQAPPHQQPPEQGPEGEQRWLVVYASDGRGVGDEMAIGADVQRLFVGGKEFSMFSDDGREVLCRGVRHEDFHLAQRAALAGVNVEPPAERDLRILPVIFDSAEERWRTVSEAVPEFEDVEFDDYPLQGPRTVSHDTRQLRRLGLDFVQHHESWLKKSGVRPTDRSVHEHSSVCRALNLMMCYDQLNLPAIAAAEALNRRRTLIEHAHQGRPDAPSYEGAEDFLGVRESADGSIVDPALAAFAAKRQATKAEVMKQTRLASEEKRLSRKGEGKGNKEKEDGGKAPGKDDGYVGDVSALHSRRSRQRVQKRRLLVSREIETVKCLNHLAGFADESSWPSSPTNFSQKSALQVVSEAHFKRPPPPERETPQAALRQLLSKKVSSGYESGDAPGQVVAYQRALLSLPRDQQDPVQLSHLLPAKEKEQLEHFADSMLLSDEEMAGVLERGFSRDKYLDPVLEGDQTEYHAFVADLFACKLLDFTIAPKSQVGVFCVAKKSGKQRLVVDARRTNKLFRSPPSTLLGSADTWTRLEFDEPGAEFFVAQEDVKDFFYRLRIHRPLGEYFALPAIDPVQLRDALGFLPPGVEELLDRHTAPIHPFFQVLPMGFSWSFHLAHMAHVELSARCLPHCGILQDRRPAPILGHGRGQHSSALLIYADNNNHIGIEREKLLEEQKNMIGSLHSHGLETHEVTDPVSLAESLGIRINGATGQVGTTAARDWRLDRALEGLAFARPRISGQELEVIVGHLTIRALLHRGLMSILRHAYVFIRRFYHQRHRLWASVALELRIFRGLMALGTANVFAAWDGQPICTDACLSGYAVMESQHSSQEVASLGRYDERWRFRWGDGRKVAPRSQALDTSKVFEDPKTVLPEVTGEVFGDLELVAGFPEVGHDFMNEKAWHPLWNSHITHKEPVHMIEARSILAAVKHRSRDHHRHRKKILILNDNMSVVLALQKGRCHNYGLLRVIRRISAHALATGQRFHIRWLASELNVADKGSRQWESERRAEDFEKRKAPKRGANFFQDRGCACKPEDAKPFSGGRPKEEEESVTFEGERTILEIHSVKEPQRKEYSRRLEEFYNFVAFHNLSIRTEGELDIAMCDYADELFLDGEGCHVGEKLKAALEYERPEGIRSGQLMLPRFKRAMKGWRKLAPQQTRLPMMEFLKSCISGLMMDMGEREMSLFNETSFSTYARPGELLRLRPVDVVPRAPGHNFDVLILNPIERGETSKAGIFDETLILDDSRAPWLGELLNQLAARRSKEVGEGGQLWPFTARKYLETWRQCVRALEVEDVAETPYQNRHGGFLPVRLGSATVLRGLEPTNLRSIYVTIRARRPRAAMGLSVSPDASLQRSLSDQQLGKVGVVHSVLVRPPETCQPHQVFQVFPGDQPLLLKLPAAWRPGVTITAFYEADSNGILQPALQIDHAEVSFCTRSCLFWGGAVLLVLSFFTFLCIFPYVLLPPLGLALLSVVPIMVFALFVQLRFASSVRICQMVISFFEAIAWFLPLVAIILIIYFPVGWQDWVANCNEAIAEDGAAINAECLGKRAIQAYLMTAFLEELLKFLCVRRLLWLPFVCDPWALSCYGGAAGLGFAAVENAIYVGGGNLMVALLRAGTAVPNHLMYGLLHGAFLSRLRFSRRSSCSSYLLSPFLPMLLHGSHNFSIALCQYLDLAVGLSVMACVALAAVVILRRAMQDLGPQVDVHELIDAKILEAPVCCLCCQGQCGWAKECPLGAVCSAQLDGQLLPEELVLVRGVGAGTYELAGDGWVSSASHVRGTGRKVYFETLVGPETNNFRVGIRCSSPSGSEETWTLGPEGLWHQERLLDARPVPKQCTIGCVLELDDAKASQLSFLVDGQPWSIPELPTSAGSTFAAEWRVQGRLLLRLARFEQMESEEVQAFQVAATGRSSTALVGQVVGVLLEE